MKKHNKLYTYNEMGHVIKKGLGYVSPTTWLQNLDMRYNIRGQLLSINNSKLTSDTGKTSSDANDVFGMRILYDQLDANVGNTPSYNGKVSAVKWMSVNASGAKSPERSFKYSYDQVDRYTGSAYAERATTATGSFGNNIGGFDEYGITYDPNGNLLTLKRNSSSPGATTHHQIDSLTYSYSSVNGNQLTNVTDGTDSLHTDAGFRNLTGSTSGYMFDPEGNLKKDYKKGITNISYNVLNRTDTLQISATQYIIYTYDAGGNLIRKQAYKSGTTTQITDYIDGFVYNNTSGTETLAYFPMPEGRVLYNASTFTQEYIITDPQGNARVSFQNVSGAAKVFQENSYYATGLIMPNSPVATPTTPNKQLYNGGSEWQNDYSNLPDYYQTFNRNYDAAIGRFIGADPVAESAESMTPYQYAGNNPVMNNDPMGDLQQTPSWWRASGQPQTVFSPTSDAFDGGDPSYDMYSIGGSYDQSNTYIIDVGNSKDGGQDMTAQGVINIIVELFNSPYGGHVDRYGFQFFNSPAEEIVGGMASLKLQETINPNIGSLLPGSASGLSDAIGRYNAIIADKRLKSQENLLSKQSGTFEDDYDENGILTGHLYGFDVNVRPDDLKVDEAFLAEGEVDAAVGTVTNFMKSMADIKPPAWLEVTGKVLGFATLLNNGRKAYNAFRQGGWVRGSLYSLEAAGQIGLWVSGAESLEMLYNVGSMGIDIGTDYYEHSKHK